MLVLGRSADNLSQDVANCIIRTDPPSTTPVTKAAHQPAYLRSFKLPVPKAAIAPKVTAALAELGISHSRLVMPTRDNVAQLESLLEATTALVETKRVVDKVEYDINVLKTRLGMREGSGAEGEGEGGTATYAMDIDEVNDGDAADDGRAQSVVSTRSARSRKHVSLTWSSGEPPDPCTYADSAINVYLLGGYSLHSSWHQAAEAELDIT